MTIDEGETSVTRVAALYDIHGNLPALEAVLDDVRRADVDLIVVGGDVVPGPMPRETLACLLALDTPTRFIRGNGEVAVLAQLAGEDPGVPQQVRGVVGWVAEQLHADLGAVLASWPRTLDLGIDGVGEVLFCHATPRDENEIFTRFTPEDRLAPVFGGLDVPIVVCGHTHMQFDRRVGDLRVLNAGSVGMPFGDPGAFWLLMGPDVQLRHTSYDLSGAAERIRATRYPQAQDFAANNVLQPPSEAEILERFAKVQLNR
jgi:predicted phosphodiesterase